MKNVSTYYQTQDPTSVSRDGHATLIPVTMAGTMDNAIKNVDRLHQTAVAVQRGGFTLAQTGDASISQMITQVAKSDL